MTAAELAELRNWLLELDWEAWDDQIERDAAAGKLERLFDEADREHREGTSSKF